MISTGFCFHSEHLEERTSHGGRLSLVCYYILYFCIPHCYGEVVARLNIQPQSSELDLLNEKIFSHRIIAFFTMIGLSATLTSLSSPDGCICIAIFFQTTKEHLFSIYSLMTFNV